MNGDNVVHKFSGIPCVKKVLACCYTKGPVGQYGLLHLQVVAERFKMIFCKNYGVAKPIPLFRNRYL